MVLDDDLVLVEDGGVAEAERGDDLGELLDRALVDAGVVLVWRDLVQGDVHDLHPIRFLLWSPCRVPVFSARSSGRS